MRSLRRGLPRRRRFHSTSHNPPDRCCSPRRDCSRRIRLHNKCRSPLDMRGSPHPYRKSHLHSPRLPRIGPTNTRIQRRSRNRRDRWSRFLPGSRRIDRCRSTDRSLPGSSDRTRHHRTFHLRSRAIPPGIPLMGCNSRSPDRSRNYRRIHRARTPSRRTSEGKWRQCLRKRLQAEKYPRPTNQQTRTHRFRTRSHLRCIFGLPLGQRCSSRAAMCRGRS